MFLIDHRHVPHTRAMLDKPFQRESDVVVFVCDHHVQRIILKGAVIMTTPATVVRHLRDASHMTTCVLQFHGTQQYALRTSIDYVTRPTVSGLKAYRGTIVDFGPGGFTFTYKKDMRTKTQS